MANSGVGQFSINVKSNLKDFYGDLKNTQKTIKELTERKNQLQIDSSQLDKLRDKSQRIAAEMRELRQQKNEIKLGMRNVDDVEKELRNIDRSIASLNGQKLKVDAEIQPIRTANVELHQIDQEIDRLNGKQIKLDASSISSSLSSGLGHLSDFSNTLSKISFAPLIAGAATAVGVVRGLADTAKSLFSELEGDINMEKVFRQNQSLLGVDTSETDAVYKELDKYSDKTIYNSAEMLNTYNALFNSGTKDTTKLVKGLGAIAATAADSKQAMSTLSLQFSQAMINGLQRTDLRYMAEATNGGLAVAFAQAGKDYEDFSRRLGEANEKTDPGVRNRLAEELEEVVRAAADNPEMNKLAETPKTIGQGFEALTASLVNVTRKGFAPLQQVGINWLTKLSQDVEGIDKDKLVDFGNEIAEFADKKIAKLYDFVKNTDFKKLWSIFSDGFSEGYESLKEHLSKYKTLFGMFFDFDANDMDIYDLAENIGKTIPKLFEWGVKFKEASLLFKGAAAGFEVFSKLSKFANIKLPASGLFSKLLGGGGKASEAISAPAINVNAFKTLAKGLGAIAGLSGTMLIGAKALQEVDKIEIGNHLPKKLFNMAAAITSMGVFAGAVGTLIAAVPAAGIATGIGAATILGLSATLAAASKAVQTLEGVEVDGNYIEKVQSVGKVLGELSSVSGGLVANNIFSIIGNAGAMINDWLKNSQLKSFARMTESLNQISEMPDIQTDTIKEKLRAVKDSLAVLDEGENWHDVPVFSNLVDFFNSISAVWEGIKDKANASSLKSFATMMKSLEDIQGADDLDIDRIETNIGMIKKAIAAIADPVSNVSLPDEGQTKKSLGVISTWWSALKEKGNASKLKSLVAMLQSFESIGDAKISPNKIGSAFKKVKEAVEEVNHSGIANITQLMKEGSFKDAAKATKSLKNIVDNVSGLSKNLKVTDIKVNIGLLREIINQINTSFQSLTNDKNTIDFEKLNKKLTPIQKIMSKMASIVKNATKSTGNIDYPALKANVSVLQAFFTDLSNQLYYLSKSGEKDGSLSLEDTESRLKDLNGIIKKMGDIVKDAQNATGNIDATSIFANLGVISQVFDEIKKTIGKVNTGQRTGAQLPTLGNADFGSDTSNQSIEDALIHLEQTSQALAKMGDIVRQAQDATGNINGESIIANLNVVKTLFGKTREILGSLGESSSSQQTGELPTLENSNFNGTVDNGGIDAALSNMDQVLKALQKIGDIVHAAQKATGNIDGTSVVANINVAATLLKAIKDALSPFAKGGDEEFNMESVNSKLDKLSIAMNKLQAIISTASGISSTSLNYDSDENGVFLKIDRVRRTIVQINDLPTPVGLEQIQLLVQEFQNLVETLNGLEGLFNPVGEGYGKQVIEGFVSVDFEGPAAEKVRRLLSRLISMKSTFREAGRQMGQSFGDGFGAKLDSIDVSNAGTKIGNQLKTNILNALNGLGTAIAEKIDVNSGTSDNSSGSSGGSSSSGLGSLPSITLAGGGLVTSQTGRAILQDSPEKPLLDNGEYVIPKKIVTALGVPFLEKLRSGAFTSQTFRNLAQSVSNHTSTVINNYNNSNSNNTTNHNTYTHMDQSYKLRGNRRLGFR